MGWLLTAKLREYAIALREAASSDDATPDSLRKQKSRYLSEIYSTLCINLGTPPKPDAAFSWDYYDKDKKYHNWTGTPKEFYAKFAIRKGLDPKDSFSLINDPRNKYEKLYTVKHLGNVWGGPAVRCKLLNGHHADNQTSTRPSRCSKTQSSQASRPTHPSSTAVT